jgi:hypothetical protein
MAETLELGIRIKADSKGLVGATRKAGKDLGRLEKQTTKTGRSAKKAGTDMRRMGRDMRTLDKQAGGLVRSFGRMAGAFALAFGAGIGTNAIIDTVRQGEILEASLKTVTGSAEAAAVAMQGLEEFAAKTPFSLDQAVQGFVKLKAFGLDPSREALESYGNTASAMGRSLNQMIEAVADAATGEFERLKEFGIKAKQQGDNVAFTFQGVTTTVKKNAADIEKFLQGIGNVEFAGAMEDRARTLDGALSNMGDSWAGLARAIGDAGLSALIQGAAKVIGGLADGLVALVTGKGAKGLPQWAKVTGFAFKAVSLEAQDLVEWFRGISAATVAFVTGNSELLDFIKSERQADRQRLEQELQDYVAMLEGIGQQVAQVELDPFKKQAATEGGGAAAASAAQKLSASIDKEVAALEREAAVFGKSRSEAALYTLALRGATDAQLAHARAAFEAIQAKEDQAAAVTELNDAIDRELALTRDLKDEQESSAEAIRDQIDPLRALRRELEEINTLKQGGFLSAAEAEQATAGIEAQVEKIQAGTSEMTQFMVQAARNMQTSLAKFLFDPFDDGLKGMLEGFANTLRQMAAEIAAQAILKSLFTAGAAASSGGAAAVFASLAAGTAHQGGIIGRPLPTRQISPLAFAGAPRLHGGGFPGLNSGEVPIIAQKGEEVLARNDPRNALNGASGVTINQTVNIEALDATDIVSRLEPMSQELYEMTQGAAQRSNTRV